MADRAGHVPPRDAEAQARTPAFRRQARLEQLLGALNGVLAEGADVAPEGLALDDPGAGPPQPILFVVGAPRTGSTLLMQRLAASGAFAYPSNLIARFWSAPHVGALVQRMLAEPEFAFRSEFADVQAALAHEIGERSDLGKTEGLLGPNEFWYFWRRYFPFADTHQLSADQLAGFDRGGFVEDLRRLRAVFGKPLVMKAMLADWHLDLLAGILPEAVFVYLDRDPDATAASLLRARERFAGDRSAWYSLKPPGYARLRRLSPEEQVAGQLREIRDAVEGALAGIPAERWLRVTYEDLCADPEGTLGRVSSAAGLSGRTAPAAAAEALVEDAT